MTVNHVFRRVKSDQKTICVSRGAVRLRLYNDFLCSGDQDDSDQTMYWFVASGGSMTKAVANPRIGTLPLRVSVLVCGRTLSLDDLVHLQAGSIIPFSDQATSSLKLFAGDKAIGLGEAVTVDSKIAIRVTKLVKQSAIEQ